MMTRPFSFARTLALDAPWPIGSRWLVGLAGWALLAAGPVHAQPAGSSASRDGQVARLQVTSSTPVENAAMPIVAYVNGHEVTREELAQECLRHYGKEILEAMVNKHLIVQQCKRQNISITSKEVDEEIDRMARRFGLSVDQWLKMLQSERGIKPAQYHNDIVWSLLALRKLAGERLVVSEDDVRREFEAQFGDAVQARIIVANDLRDAQQLRAEALASPDKFGRLAKEHSVDFNSASANGRVQPIHKHMGDPQVEQAAFAMKDGEISEVIRVGKQFVILQRESLIPARKADYGLLKGKLKELVNDRRMHVVATEVFRELQANARIENIYNDPVKREQMPGVAALINAHPITIHELAEETIQRHGEEVLEGTINRRLIEQGCQRAGITITDRDLDEEIVRAASTLLPPKKDGTPDVETWIKRNTEQQGISVELYRRDSVWPSVALRRMVKGKVQVTDEDLQKAYEANYGPRVRCKAIILGNHRQAQHVWEMARENTSHGEKPPTPEFFGELAAQFSIEGSSRALQGDVPPIKKNGGQPILEQQAFALRPGELSSIIQSGDKYVILLSEGFTEPVKVDFGSVRGLLVEDLYEKKLRLEMAQRFQELQDEATIDNLLAGTSTRPANRSAGGKLPPGVPQIR
jgi:parvulin-like peptidyl-prolyl isomerase